MHKSGWFSGFLNKILDLIPENVVGDGSKNFNNRLNAIVKPNGKESKCQIDWIL